MSDEIVREARELWKSQRTPARHLSREEMRSRAESTRVRARSWAALRSSAMAIAILANCAALLFAGSPYVVVFYVVAWGGIAVQLMGMPQAMVANTLRHEPLALNLSAEPPSCLDSYQKTLETQLYMARPLRYQSVMVGIFGLVLAATGARRTAIAVPLGMTQFVAAVWWYRSAGRNAPQLQAELDELRAFRANQQAL